VGADANTEWLRSTQGRSAGVMLAITVVIPPNAELDPMLVVIEGLIGDDSEPECFL